MKHGMGAEDDQAPELAIPLETLCIVIMKAHQFDAKEAATEPDPGSNPTDDENAAILQDQADDPGDVRVDVPCFLHQVRQYRRTHRDGHLPQNAGSFGHADIGVHFYHRFLPCCPIARSPPDFRSRVSAPC